MTDFVPPGETRKYFFANTEFEEQSEVLSQIKINAPSFLIIYRLEKNLNLEEFKKVVSHIGKPKVFYQLARYSEVMQRSVVIGFDNPQDKRYFMNVFRMVFPDYLVQELSKIIKLFCMTPWMEEAELDWKDFFLRKFKEAQTVFLSTGAEILAADYRLSKHPLMQPFMPLKTVIVEFSSPGYAFEALLQVNECSIQHADSPNLYLYGMFEADEEQKSVIIEKKEQTKIEDDGEKAEKHIDNYLSKQMAMMMTPDQMKETGLDKANSQTKSYTFFKILGDQQLKQQVTSLEKYLTENRGNIQVNLGDNIHHLAELINYYQEAVQCQGPFNRYNEPILMTTQNDANRYWLYDQLKYTNKRDPSLEELRSAASSYQASLGKKAQEIINNYSQAQKEFAITQVCCVTHASSLQLLNADVNNVCRTINKFVVSGFFKELGLQVCDPKYDQQLVQSEDTKNKLNTLMPLLNSVQLWGRYKQKFQFSFSTVYHCVPYLKQSFHEDTIYRNVNWVYGLPSINDCQRMGTEAIYQYDVNEAYLKSIIRFKEGKYTALPPFQVLKYIGCREMVITEELPLRRFKIFTFEVCDDYKNHITWQRKEVIKGKQ